MTFSEVSSQMEDAISSGSYNAHLCIPQGLDQRQTLSYFKKSISDIETDADIESMFFREFAFRLGTDVRKGILKQIALDSKNTESPWNSGHHVLKTSNPTEIFVLTDSLKCCHGAIRQLVSHCPSNQALFGQERIFELARQLIDKDKEIGVRRAICWDCV